MIAKPDDMDFNHSVNYPVFPFDYVIATGSEAFRRKPLLMPAEETGGFLPPDVRMGRVALALGRIESGYYDDDDVLSMVTERIIGSVQERRPFERLANASPDDLAEHIDARPHQQKFPLI